MVDDEPKTREARHHRIEVTWWMQTRVEAALREAATIAICPDYVVTPDNFVAMARNAIDNARAEFERRVQESTAVDEDMTDSPTPPTKPGEQS